MREAIRRSRRWGKAPRRKNMIRGKIKRRKSTFPFINTNDIRKQGKAPLSGQRRIMKSGNNRNNRIKMMVLSIMPARSIMSPF